MATCYETALDQGELLIDPPGSSSRRANAASLSELAKTFAPQYCEAVLASPGRSKSVLNQLEGDLESIRTELQRWFVELFNPGNPDGQDRAHSQRARLQLPLSFLLRNLDITLRYGRQVTALGPRSEQAQRRFIRSLSDELAKRQVAVEQRLAYMSELCVLD